ncbi:alginate O-acetyltransferase [Pseudomonas citronellolis]|uniref:alginate O-acetyltransferase n=1 Tax=Pseudomonas citronellolis TaxID=53408 RepID=UPI0023E443B6|nr:alginate O-acetyltransferase [Pseudomonas citronellolis]MDF3935374.1 alginate O-acetyltransferase [Pseudomonas citronellolis]
MTPRNRHLTPVLLLGALGLAHGASAAEAPPSYVAEPCCQLCPQAAAPQAYASGYLQAFRTLHAGRGDWLFRSELDLNTQFGTTATGWSQLKTLHDALQAKGVELLVVYMPTRGLVDRNQLDERERASFDYDKARRSYLATLERFRSLGIHAPDLSPLFDGAIGSPFFFAGDHHWTPEGSRRSAQIVAEAIRRLPVYARITREHPAQAFETHRAGLLPKYGSLNRAAERICGGSYAPLYFTQYQTAPVQASDGASQLFDDNQQPDVVLAGTSNSGPAYNFDGFLRQYSGLDVFNVAVDGGNLEGALLLYTGSAAFHRRPPKLLIWEFATYSDLDQAKTYRQLLPLVRSDGCNHAEPLLSQKTRLHAGRNELLLNRDGRPITSGRTIADLRFSDPGVRRVEITVWYMNGRQENLKLELPSLADNGGRFVFSLRDDADWRDHQVLALDVQPPPFSGPLEVDARLCQAPAARVADSGAPAKRS